MKAIFLAPFQLIKSIYLFFWNGWCASDNPQMEAITIAFAFFAAGLALLVFIYVGAYVTNPAHKSVQQQHLAMPAYAPAPAPTLAPAFAPTAASTYAGVFGRPRVHHHEIMPPGRADAFTAQSEYIWR